MKFSVISYQLSDYYTHPAFRGSRTQEHEMMMFVHRYSLVHSERCVQDALQRDACVYTDEHSRKKITVYANTQKICTVWGSVRHKINMIG